MKSILIIAILFLSPGIFAQDPPEKYQKLWMQINEGDPTNAIKELKKIVKKETKDPWPYWMLGIASWYGPQSAERTEYFKKSLAADPNFAPAHYGYASSLDQTDPKLQTEIEEHYTKAIQLDSTSSVYYEVRGDFYYQQKKYDQAIADCEKAKILEPENAYFPNKTIIECLHDQGKLEELKQFLLDTPDLGVAPPEDPDFNYLLATIYENFGDKRKACLIYKQAISEFDSLKEMFADDEDFKNPDWYETARKKVKECK